MKQVIKSKLWRAEVKLAASATIAGLIVGICLSPQLVTSASASEKFKRALGFYYASPAYSSKHEIGRRPPSPTSLA